MAEPVKSVGNFGMNGWSQTPEERVKAIMINYRCCNSDQSILYSGVVSMGKTYNAANHDPEQMAKSIKRDLESLLGAQFDSPVVESQVVNDDDGRYSIEISASVKENGKRYDLRTILKSNGDDLFSDYDQTYFDFKF
jgi:hypothetical protein